MIGDHLGLRGFCMYEERHTDLDSVLVSRFQPSEHLAPLYALAKPCVSPDVSFQDFMSMCGPMGVVCHSPVGELIAAMSYRFVDNDTRIRIGFIFVAPRYRRRGVGSALLAHLTQNLVGSVFNRVLIETHESNVAMQLFLRANKFRVIKLLQGRGFNNDTYVFQFRNKQREAKKKSVKVRRSKDDIGKA